MALVKTRTTFADSDLGKESKQKLTQMVVSDMYNTTATYSANKLQYPDNLLPFIDKHMNYLASHPLIDPDKYIANIKLMTKLR